MNRSPSLDYHLGRLLLLLRHFAPSGGQALHGLTKLAKIDFLLRYPSFTDRLVATRNLQWPDGTTPTPDELLAVESRMVRYKYGPWDDRYYPLVGALIGMGLAEQTDLAGTLKIRLTHLGSETAAKLARRADWAVADARAAFLAKNFDLSGNQLKILIYAELPDVVDRSHRSVI
jgi:hypothetical protein